MNGDSLLGLLVLAVVGTIAAAVLPDPVLLDLDINEGHRSVVDAQVPVTRANTRPTRDQQGQVAPSAHEPEAGSAIHLDVNKPSSQDLAEGPSIRLGVSQPASTDGTSRTAGDKLGSALILVVLVATLSAFVLMATRGQWRRAPPHGQGEDDHMTAEEAR